MGRPIENPWLSMWVRPRETIQSVIDYAPGYRFWSLSWLAGFPTALQVAQAFSLSDAFSFPVLLLLTICAAFPLGALWIYMMGGVLYLTGKWMGGKGSFAELRAVVSWSTSLMWIFFILSCAVFLIYYGKEWFSPAWVTVAVSQTMAYVALGLWSVQFLILLWTLYVLVHALAQVQGFSIGKSVGNILLSAALLWALVRALGS